MDCFWPMQLATMSPSSPDLLQAMAEPDHAPFHLSSHYSIKAKLQSTKSLLIHRSWSGLTILHSPIGMWTELLKVDRKGLQRGLTMFLMMTSRPPKLESFGH